MKEICIMLESLDFSNEVSPLFYAPLFVTKFDDNKGIERILSEIVKERDKINELSNKFRSKYNEIICNNLGWKPKIDICPDFVDYVKILFDDNNSKLLEIKNIYSYLIGCVFGRWDITVKKHKKDDPANLPLFSPFPSCPPGMLKSSTGFPIEEIDLPSSYPINIYWNGILPIDLSSKENTNTPLHEAINFISQSNDIDLEHELSNYLKIKSLLDYFSNPTKFFKDHLKRYSKSRREAPIYWPISIPSGVYTLWLYYHRLTDQTLYTCINDFIEPKIENVSSQLADLQAKTDRSTKEEKELEKLTDLELELRDFREEILHIAKFWKPNLNDGVQITAAPLWNLFRLPKWHKKLKTTWLKLEKGDYDWAHLAYSTWPERIIAKAHKDRSLAIAHDLENDLWNKFENGTNRQGNLKYKWEPKKLSKADIDELIALKTGR